MQESNDVMSEVDMSGLTSEQQEVVRKMMKEDAAPNAKNGDDIGCTESLQMDIDLSGSIPSPLYQDVKNYIENVLNKQVITK